MNVTDRKTNASDAALSGSPGTRKLRVGFFADILYYKIGAGSTRYAGELSKRLLEDERIDLQPFAFYPPETIATLAEKRGYPPARPVPSLLPRSGEYALWNVIGWSPAAGGIAPEADIIHTPTLCVPPTKGRPLIVSVMDMTFSLFPQYHSRKSRWVVERGLARAKKQASAFIAISQHTADDLIRVGGADKDKVHVIPLAADERFRPTPDRAVPERYGIDSRYVLYVGTLEPRKNVSTLLQAFARVSEPDVKLVLVGSKGWMYEDIFQTLERLNLSSRVIVTDFVPNEDLPALITEATAFVYPSVYEGFGLPVLEAMQCGTPVVTTNVSSLPEVAGDAARLVAPDDTEGFCRAITQILTDRTLAEDLRGRGLAQAARFSWQKTARMTGDVYRLVAG